MYQKHAQNEMRYRLLMIVLSTMLADLYEESEVVRTERVEREEVEPYTKGSGTSKEDRRQRYNLEVERTIELENRALDAV